MASNLIAKGVSAKFAVVGPDEGELCEVKRVITESGVGDRVVYEGALAPVDTQRRLAEATVLVLPSVNEPFPMVVLEAMAIGRPVVVTDSCGLASDVRRFGAGTVVDESLEALSDAVAVFLTDQGAAQDAGDRGAAAVREELGVSTVIDEWEVAAGCR